MCCICGGGDRSGNDGEEDEDVTPEPTPTPEPEPTPEPTPEPEPTPVPEPDEDGDDGVCVDTAGDLEDAYGDGCDWYISGSGCGNYDTDEFKAEEMCCGCGGGAWSGDGD